jgi:hypothetical protein
MQSLRKPAVRKKAVSVRQSVTMPALLAREVRRVAKERSVTMSRALVTLAERGVEAEAAARAELAAAYDQFMAEMDPARKSEVGDGLIRSISGEPRLPNIRFINLPRPLWEHMWNVSPNAQSPSMTCNG